jgi:hypothetical protein
MVHSQNFFQTEEKIVYIDKMGNLSPITMLNVMASFSIKIISILPSKYSLLQDRNLEPPDLFPMFYTSRI